MAKVRVPKDQRPPNRYGLYKHEYSDAICKVSGKYRLPKYGEYFWYSRAGHVGRAQFDFDNTPCVIMERVK